MTAASGLRAVLDDGIFAILGDQRLEAPIVLRSATLRATGATVPLTQSPLGRLRGLLVNQLVRLLAVGYVVRRTLRRSGARVARRRRHERAHRDVRPADRGRSRPPGGGGARPLGRPRAAIGSMPGQWLPRSAVRAALRLAGGSVELRDVVDLVVGATSVDVASTALLDVTTAPLGGGDERTMRYHALVHTLRTSAMPLRTATFSSATDEFWIRDVDAALLMRSVDDVLAAIDDRGADDDDAVAPTARRRRDHGTALPRPPRRRR